MCVCVWFVCVCVCGLCEYMCVCVCGLCEYNYVCVVGEYMCVCTKISMKKSGSMPTFKKLDETYCNHN